MPRQAGYRHHEDIRKKIQATQIINRLYKHFMGEVSLKPEQVNSGKILLNKVLPDLKAHEVDAVMEGKITVVINENGIGTKNSPAQ